MDIKARRIRFFERKARSLLAALENEVAAEHRDGIAVEATSAFADMLDVIPYADRPEHVMAESMLVCYAVLAFLQPMRQRGYDEHVLGRAAIESLKNVLAGRPTSTASAEALLANREQMQTEALESQESAAADEFVFEMVAGGGRGEYGMNVHRCAVCHAYGKHDAMDLVPYMCASDDVVSDALGQGLRRTGTIALGAHHCDFRFKRHGRPARLEEHYPERIQLKTL